MRQQLTPDEIEAYRQLYAAARRLRQAQKEARTKRRAIKTAEKPKAVQT